MASTYLSRTPSSNGSETKGTFSAWVKKTGLGDYYKMYTSYQASNEFLDIQFNNSDQLAVTLLIGGSTFLDLRTTRLFRDTNAWYHIVVVIDSTDSTQADRCKIYVNGVRITDFATNTNNVSSSGTNMRINSTSQNVYIGSWHNADYFDGSMTHVHWIDGTAYQSSTFGETDSTSGIWKPKTAPSVTYGTNGFFLKFENSGAMGTDSSGNTNTLTPSGTLTQNVDSPSNNFSILNILSTHGNNTLSFGSNRIAFTANTSYTNSIGSLGINSGRWYVEAKVAGATTYYPCIGFCSMGNNTRRYYDPLYTAAHLGADEGTGYFAHGNIQKNGSTDGDYATFTTGDIIGMYLDLESGTKTMKYYKNNSLVKSTDITPVDGQFYTFGATGTSSSDIVDFNFGSGFFGTTAVASANADANGFGAFEYSPTLGGVNYYTLNTKNIKEFG